MNGEFSNESAPDLVAALRETNQAKSAMIEILLKQVEALREERKQDTLILNDFMAHISRKYEGQPPCMPPAATPPTAEEARAKKWPNLPPTRFSPGYDEWISKNGRPPTHQDYFPWGQHCMRGCPCGEGPDL